jgi:hypothetical protein
LRIGLAGVVPKAALTEVDDEDFHPIFAPIEHAELVIMRMETMMFRGVERDKSGLGYEHPLIRDSLIRNGELSSENLTFKLRIRTQLGRPSASVSSLLANAATAAPMIVSIPTTSRR